MSSSTAAACAAIGEPNLSQLCAPSQLVLFMSIIDLFIAPKFTPMRFCDADLGPSDSYDFIVVGGGSAGAVVAGRLSEVESWNVLLVEAGPEEPLATYIPSMTAFFLGSEYDWKYRTTGERNACLSSNGSCSWPRGRNLGGSGVHNGMMYMRGHAKDYDGWAIPGWTWNDVLPYFKRSENNREFAEDKANHGTGGPLHIGRFSHQPEITKDILEAAQEAGFGVSEDLNGQKITGFNVAQTTSVNGTRVSSATAFLRPVRNRKNLRVLVNAQVTQVLFDSEGKASGVRYIKNGTYHDVSAKREVILSAGAVGSPHILLLSGVGPARHLEEKGVNLVKDLPGVGQNLQNHVSYTLEFQLNYREGPLGKEAADEYIGNQRGPISSTGLSQFTGILSSKYTTPDHPDIQLFFGGFGAGCDRQPEGSEVSQISISPVYLHTRSRGVLQLATKNPLDHPVITQNYLTDERDVLGLIEAVNVALTLSKTKALGRYNMSLTSAPNEACADHEFMSEKYLRCAIAQDTVPENHQASSCKMGLTSDPLAVVDNRLRVMGIKGLRVADVSILPKIISANTAGPAMMIGERVAAFIKEEYQPARTK